ncbi:hypothetical protein Ciccas_010299 [Cichlidogyrus casuarinus]|uniref:Amino acid transporter transmembrane domain-containing protein n=1 Tax=Cichlidogyrus casuarinus TaxID=1844966 RepID=A0ABD2PW42_9PLAT
MSDEYFEESDVVIENVESSQPKISWYSAGFIIMNACLGAGILAFPLAYHKAGGVLVSMILQTVRCFYCYVMSHKVFLIPACVAIVFLGYASDIRKTDSYERTLEVVAGRPGKIVFSILLFLGITGASITFLIVISDLLDRGELSKTQIRESRGFS